MLSRPRALPTGFPALPADESAKAAFQRFLLHEIKHDGFRVIHDKREPD